MNTALLATLMRWRMNPTWNILGGAAVWVVALAVFHPSPFAAGWARLVLLLAALCLVPLGLELIGGSGFSVVQMLFVHVLRLFQLPAALFLSGAYFLEPGWPAALLVVPWVLHTGAICALGVIRARMHLGGKVADLCIDAGLIYLVVGGLWALCERFGYRPLDFDPVIVLLTAIHFHYAGFVLPLITGRVLRESEGGMGRIAGWGVILGVPLVAVGITTTHLRWGSYTEFAAAWVLAGAAAVVSVLQLRLALRKDRPVWPRVLWGVSAVCLLGSMVLAGLYGSRTFVASGLTSQGEIEWMRALHGSANAVGFAVCGLVGWRLSIR